MSWSQTLSDYTFTQNDFAGTNYVTGIPLFAQKAAVHAADLLNGTSSTSITIGAGTKTFTTQTAKAWRVGAPMRITRTANPTTHFMDGIVTAYDPATGSITVEVGVAVGSGAFSAWTLNVGGARVAATLPLSIAEGGTGTTSADAALTNLGGTTLGTGLFKATGASVARGLLGASAIGGTIFTAADGPAVRSAIGAGVTGDALFVTANSGAARSVLGVGATGDALFVAANALAALAALGFSAIGAAISDAADAAEVRTLLEASAIGTTLFTAADAAAVRTAIQMYSQIGTYTAPQRGALSSVAYSASLTLDLATSNNFSIGALTGGLTLNNPSNQVAGQSGIIFITQDGTGGRTITYGTNWFFEGGVEPALSTGANARDALFYFVQASGAIYCTLLRGFA